jgi:hypothetical protein
VVAIVAMKYAVVRPSKDDSGNAIKELGIKSVLGENSTKNTQSQQKTILPNATMVLVLGIVSIATSWFLSGIVGIVIGTIGLVMGNKDMILYQQSPDDFSESSFKNIKTGRICSMIGLGMSVFSLIFSFRLFF